MGKIREIKQIEHASFIEIFWYLVSLAHFMTFTLFRFFKSTQHLNTLQMPIDLVFGLKWGKSVIGCTPYIFHLSWQNRINFLSPGLPKGVCHSHFSILNILGSLQSMIKSDSIMVATTCFFHLGGFFTGINAVLKHQSYYHVSC